MLLPPRDQATLALEIIQAIKWIDFKPITIFELLSLLLALAGVLAVVKSLRTLSRQTKLLITSVRCDTYASITSNLALTKQVFIKHPALRPYFYSGLNITDKDNNYHRAIATAEHLLDFFDGVLLQEESQLWEKDLWENYIRYSFKNAPILCSYLEQYKEWYTQRLFDLMKTASDEWAKQSMD